MTIAVSMTKANRLERDHKLEDAANIYRDILAKFPKNTRARAALDTLQNRMQHQQNPPVELQQKLQAAFNAGQHANVASACASLLNSYRRSHFLWHMLGVCHLQAKNLDEAATCLNKACDLNPKDAETFCSMADVCHAQGQIENAIALYRKALKLNPDHLITLNNLSNTLSSIGQIDEAIQQMDRAAKLAPDNAAILFNYSNALLKIGRKEQAKTFLERATTLQPQLAEAQYNLAQLQSLDGDKEDAIDRFETMLAQKPGDDRTRANKLHAQAQLNDWAWITEYQEHRRQLGLTGSAISPFSSLTFEDNPDLLRLRTQAYANKKMPAAKPFVPLAADKIGTPRPARIKIGYFSADFHDHATMQLMAGLLEAHDKSRFEIIAYSYDSRPADAMRQRVQAAVSSFKDISQLSDAQVLELAQQDGLDIAVDLKGYTGETRCTLFAQRLAPLQISYLGFPGTLGSMAFDYFVGDHVTCPAGSERCFEEHLIRMPNSYQATDSSREISARAFTRKDCGLPNEGFVFCSFNNSYKITPVEFDIWMRLLSQVEGSVLWLLDTGETSKENLRRAAQQRGVDADRLIFAPRLPQAEHLARHKVADLFLDTFVVNAHTSASDALWAGLPVLTLPGQQFAARVAASLVKAVGLPDLIAKSAKDYEAKALHLATDQTALTALRSKLGRNRLTTPLFDTATFTRDLETAYDMVHARYRQGLFPTHLNVSDAPPAQNDLIDPAFLAGAAKPGTQQAQAG